MDSKRKMCAMFVLIELIFIFEWKGSALKCYICDSETNPDCENNVKNLESQVSQEPVRFLSYQIENEKV